MIGNHKLRGKKIPKGLDFGRFQRGSPLSPRLSVVLKEPLMSGSLNLWKSEVCSFGFLVKPRSILDEKSILTDFLEGAASH